MAHYDYTVKFGAMTDKASFANVQNSLDEVLKKVESITAELRRQDIGTGLNEGAKQRLKELTEAEKHVKSFSEAFSAAENKSLGTFNMVKFNNELKKTNIDLTQVAKAYGEMGSQGTRNFRELTAEILSTNRNLEKTTTFIDSMMTTMGNTIKWGISSSIMNSFTGAIQSSYNYVKDLDRSLNNIRIVSEKSADQMERFAKNANQVAKSLGTTTLDYTNAALIYEQQGLADEEVTARTATTLKMSNVLGTSADEVSDYMTAIWNNFYEEGGKSLEYYADALTKLGAATASSAEEISTGLEKFAAIADTVGLSYEYATAALTTVTAATRQSAEVVGTAFKTLFARIQDLELGETLEDGVTLGKYSEALDKIGISILDTNGEMKDMDKILDEMGSKWDTLTKAQQVSLAQTVAGTRQYNQLVALMDNWDSFSKNISLAANATGELDKQQAIYADSVQAHMKAMEASWEGAYDAFFDEDTIKTFADAMKGLGDIVKNLIGGMGGGGNTLLALASTLTTLGSEHIARGLAGLATNAKNAKNNAAILNAELEIMEKFKGLNIDDSVTKELINMKQKILSYGNLATDEQQNELDAIINTIAQLENQRSEWDENAKAAARYALAVQEVYANHSEDDVVISPAEAIQTQMNDIKGAGKSSTGYLLQIQDLDSELSNSNASAEEKFEKWRDLTNKITKDIASQWSVLLETAGSNADELTSKILKTTEKLQNAEKGFNAAKKDKKKIEKDKVKGKNVIEPLELDYSKGMQEGITGIATTFDKLIEDLQAKNPAEFLKQYSQESIDELTETTKKLDEVRGKYYELENSISTTQIFNNLTNVAGSIGQVTSGLLAIKNIGNIFDDDTLSSGEKVLQILTSLSTSIPMLVNGITTFTQNIGGVWKGIAQIVTAKALEIEAKKAEAKANLELAATSGAAATGEATLAAANVAAGGSAAAATPAIGSMAAAVGALLWPILLVVAAVAALAAGIYAVVKAYNKDADAAKAANEQMNASIERYEKLNTEAKELKETLEGYNESLKTLEKLTKTTEGFEEALSAANDKAKELIETYGLYGEGDWSYGDKGQIVISDEAQARIQAQADQKAHTAEKQMYGAKIYAGQATLKSQTTDLRRDIGAAAKYYFDENGNKQYGVNKSTYSRENHGGSEEFSNDDLQFIGNAFNELGEELDLLEDGPLEETLLAMDDLPEAVRGNIDAIIENRDELEVLAKSMSDTAAAADFYAKQMLENSIEEKYGTEINKLATTKDASGKDVVNEGRANLITSILANESQDQSDAMSKELQAINVSNASSNNKLNDKYGYDVQDDKDLARTYAEKVLGYSEADAAKLTYDGGWNKGTLKDKSGETILDSYSDDYMREELARIAKEEEITKKYKNKLDGQGALDNIGEIIGAGTAAGTKYGTDFTDAFLQSMANEDKKIDLSSSFAELDPNEVQNIMGTEDKNIASLLGIGEEDWKAMGYTSSAEFGKAFKEGLTDWEWDRDAAVSAQVGKIDLEKYDLEKEELEDYAKHLMNVSSESGELAKTLETDAEASAKVAKSIMRMNNSVEELAENFDDWKDVMEKSSKESEEYHEALSGMQNAVADLLDTEEDYVSDDFLQSHFEDIEKAAEGDAEAIDRLKQALAEDIIMKVAISNDVSAEKQAEIKTWIQEIQDMSKDIEIGANIDLDSLAQDEQKLMETMQNIIAASGMTAEEANAAFSSMGFQTNFAMEEVPVEQTVPNTITETKILEQKKDFFGNVTYQKVRTNTYQDGVDKFTGKQMQIAMETSKDGKKVPKLASVVKTGTGAANNWSKKNSGGGAVKSSSGSKPKQEKHLESELDIYHDVNVELGKISSSLDKVQSSTDQLVGQSKIENLAEQYALLNSQIDTTAEKIDIARGEMSDLAKDLAGKGIKFDKDGTISNYAEAYNQQLAYVNSIIDRYNGMSSEAQEAYQETYDKAKEDFDKFVEDIGRYDELLTDEIPGLQTDIQDAINKQIELKLEAFHQEIEIRLDMAEAERDWNEFFNKVIKDIEEEDILGNAEAKLENFMSYYKDGMKGVIQVNAKHIQDILADLKAMDEGLAGKFYSKDGVDNRAQALEDLKTYYEQLMEDLEAVHDLSDEIHESYVDMIDEAQEKFDEQISTFETINNLLEHDKNVISMIYGEESYSALSQFYDRQEENYNKQLDFQKQQMVFWQQQMAAAEEGSDAWNAAKENWVSAVDAWNSAIETAIQNLQDKYLNAINAIFQALNDKATGGMGLGYVETEWDLINQNADQYLDTVNAIYKVQELQNKYLDAIEKSSNPTQQKKLNDLMQQETDYLREQDKLTEYDLERANLKYEIALKQMALEEAQQNKSKLRLRRDSQGNYTYQYTQDEDQIASIQSEIADLYNQLYNLDTGAYKGNLEEIFSIWQEFQERMAEAAQINDPEQRAAKELLIKEQYSELINGLVERNETLQANMYQSTMSQLFDLYNQNALNYEEMSEDQKAILDQFISAETDLNNAAFDNLFNLYNVNIQQFERMTDEQRNILMGSMVPQWNAGVQNMIDKIAGEGGFTEICKEAFEELDSATRDYMEGLEELQKNADVSFDEIKEGIDEVIVNTEDLLKNNNELIENYDKELEAIQNVIDQLDDLVAKYQEAEAAAKAATEEAYKYWQQEQNKNASVDNKIDKPAENKPANTTPATPAPKAPEPAKPSLNTGSYIEVKSGTRWYADSYGGGASGPARSGKISYINLRGSHPYNIGGLGWIRKTDIVGYDTGGYTGDWNSTNGRLAMLHKKELVLNAHDTENMLSAITILRDLTANLGATLLNKMASITSGNIGTIGQNMGTAGLEQSVVINAEFPNATNSREIEEALNNLVNRASQHISK